MVHQRVSEVLDVDKWLKSNGINKRWALSVVIQVKREYPALGQAMKEYPSNRPELELMQLIDHVMKGRFPVKQNE